MNVPKLRFKEFNDDWKNYILNEESDVRDGTHDSPKYIDDGYPLVTSKNLNDDGTLDLDNVSYLKQEDFDKINQRSKVDVGDILFGMIGTIGKPVRIMRDDFAIKNVALIKEKGLIKNDYLIHYLHSSNITKQFANNMDGGTQKFIALDKIRKLKINMPSREEQKKIVKLFDLLDEKIKLQARKIEDLKLFKKGLHDKLFNEVTGNDYLLSDIAVFENGKGHENIIDENGKYILINSKFISTEGNVTKKCYEQLTPLFKNDITMVMSDLPNGKALAKCYYIDENNKYSLNQRICKIKVKDDSIINSKYLFYLLNRNSYYLRFDDGVNQTNLKKDDILSLNLVLPSIKEQERDSKTLTIIDNFIEKENNKLSKLFLLKKGLMQSMFV